MTTGSTPTTDRCEIIAEAGINHNGELDIAKELVAEASAAGVDAVKFQTFQPQEIVTEATEKAAYQERDSSGNQYDMLSDVVLSDDEHALLVDHCRELGLEFMSTPYDPESVGLLEDLGVERFKIASADIVNKPLLRSVAETKKPVVLSTGMASLGEIERAVSFLESGGCPDLTLLHCVSCYPATPEQVNMRFMETLRSAFEVPVGFSDHTLGTDISLLAAGMGASVLEKHFTLDREMDGPDHFASLEPDELASMVDGVRGVETALGSTGLRRSEKERSNATQMRRSLHLRTDLNAGERISRKDLKIVRPYSGIDPWEIDQVVGQSLTAPVEEDDALTWEQLR